MLLLGEGSEATEPYNKYDKIRPHSFRSLQFDQKVRPLSFRPEKFDLFTTTQKKLEIFFSKFYRIFFSKNQKNGLSGAPGPASASPWRAKRGTLPKLSTFLLQLKEEPFGEKTNFRKKSLNAEKLKGGPFGIFKHPMCCKISKKLKGDPLKRK